MAELSSGSSALEHLYVRSKTEKRNLRDFREQENHSEHLNMQQGNPISNIISLLHGTNWNQSKNYIKS